MSNSNNVRLTNKERTEITNDEKLVLFYREHPVEAVRDLFGIELTWYQRITLRQMWEKRFVIVMMARGLSKTYLSALFITLYCMLYPGVKIGIIAPSYRQTWYLMDYIDEFINKSAFVSNSIIGKTTTRSNMRAIGKFKNGSYCEALPIGDGTKIRGRRYHIVIIDEAAQMDDTTIRLVVIPMMNVKRLDYDNKLIMCSTAYYPFNHFYGTYVQYKYLEMTNPNYAVCEFDIDDHLSIKNPPFEFDRETIERARTDPNSTDEEFWMEYYCKFPIEMQNFITPSLIQKCILSGKDETSVVDIDGEKILMEGSPVELIGDKKSIYVAGVDVARSAKGDNFAITVIKTNHEGTNHRIVNCFAGSGFSFQEMTSIIRIYSVDFNLKSIYMDKSGGGAALEDLLFQSWTDFRTDKVYPPIFSPEDKDLHKVTGLGILFMKNFTQQFVSLMYHSLKANMQHQNIFFPIDRRRDPNKNFEIICHNLIQLKQELVQLRAEPKGPFVHFPVSSKQKKDRATSLGLANLAANEFKKDNIKLSFGTPPLPIGQWVS